MASYGINHRLPINLKVEAGGGGGSPPPPSAADAYWDWFVGAYNPGAAGAAANAGAAGRAAAKKQLDIQKKLYEFQLSTGIRDIEEQREEGLEGAINNALQRGIYRSGIRQKNEAEVHEDANEDKSDLEQKIAFALEQLQAQREGIAAQGAASAAANANLGLPSLAEAKAIYAWLAGLEGSAMTEPEMPELPDIGGLPLPEPGANLPIPIGAPGAVRNPNRDRAGGVQEY